MKVVLFCGGLGMRLRDQSEGLPKPMVHIGYRPILWHVMKYYAHFGHKDFILCLGHRADIIKSYFRNYDETVSNDFILTGGREVQLLNSDIDDWRIAFVDTGTNATIGERLKAVEPFLEGEEVFLANYSDGLTDLDLNSYIDEVLARGTIANFLCVRPTQTSTSSRCATEASWMASSQSPSPTCGSTRVLRVPKRHLPLYRPRRGPGVRTVRSPDQRWSTVRLQVHRLLDGHGHLQGQGASRGVVRAGFCPLAGLERRRAEG